LAFLEAAGLTTISQDRQRIVTLTQAGKSHLDRAARDATDLGLLIRKLRINQERVMARIGDER
jgi:DNA-binding PadR family transcriptional regulator